MKRTSSKRGVSTRLALAASMLAAPALVAPAATPALAAVADMYLKVEGLKFKIDSPIDIVGEADGHTVYRDARGQCFFLDGTTGDKKMLSCVTGQHIKTPILNVKLLGIDAHGNTIQQNSRGEKFYLNPQGDMIPVK